MKGKRNEKAKRNEKKLSISNYQQILFLQQLNWFHKFSYTLDKKIFLAMHEINHQQILSYRSIRNEDDDRISDLNQLNQYEETVPYWRVDE